MEVSSWGEPVKPGGAVFLCLSRVVHTPSPRWFLKGLDQWLLQSPGNCKQWTAVAWLASRTPAVFKEKLQGFLDSTLYLVGLCRWGKQAY